MHGGTIVDAGRKVLFVYGGGSVKTNGCYEDVKTAVGTSGGTLFELPDASRELADIERCIELVKDNGISVIRNVLKAARTWKGRQLRL